MSFPPETLEWAVKKRALIIDAAYVMKIKQLEEKGAKSQIRDLEKILDNPSHPKRPDILNDKKLIAQVIKKHLGHKYGFGDALRKGTYFQLPHEMSEAICSTQMVANYVVAKECGLRPVIREIEGCRRAGSSFVSAHAIVEVDVGEENLWVLCQEMLPLGAVTWNYDDKTFSIKNEEHGQVDEFEFTYVDTFTEAEYLERIKYLRSDEGAAKMLVKGQRAGYSTVDFWKTRTPLPAEWFVRYYPKEQALVSGVTLDRLLVQKRGLENKIFFDGNKIIREEVTGYFFRESGWAEFLDNIPVMVLPMATISSLREDFLGLTVEEQCKLEDKIQNSYLEGDYSQLRPEFLEAVIYSHSKVKNNDSVRKFSMAEALYQNARKEARKDLLFSMSEHSVEFDLRNEDGGDELSRLDAQRNVEKRMKRLQRMIDQRISGNFHIGGMSFGSGTLGVLAPEQIDDEHMQRFRALRNGDEKALYLLEKKANFCYEAADRVCFAKEVLAPHTSSMEAFEAYARGKLGEKFDAWMSASYARIFTELLGMASNCYNQLRLDGYRDRVLDKLRKSKI